MKTNALAVANYFIELALKESRNIALLGLMKRVYIAHGFSLALTGQSLLDERFDSVEAWKYGPVIPSVYHSFKQNKYNPITEKSVIMEWDSDTKDFVFTPPELTNAKAMKIVEMVWARYKNFTDRQMVDVTHKEGSPWSLCYIPEMNCIIPDSYTQLYYKKIVGGALNSLQ